MSENINHPPNISLKLFYYFSMEAKRVFLCVINEVRYIAVGINISSEIIDIYKNEIKFLSIV